MKHCFVIPVYNHPHYLAALLSHLSAFELPIIMVNDGSDATCTAVLHQLAQDYPRVDLVEHTYNQGKGQAVITGLKHALAQWSLPAPSPDCVYVQPDRLMGGHTRADVTVLYNQYHCHHSP